VDLSGEQGHWRFRRSGKFPFGMSSLAAGEAYPSWLFVAGCRAHMKEFSRSGQKNARSGTWPQ
jgi:hypothetical protein